MDRDRPWPDQKQGKVGKAFHFITNDHRTQQKQPGRSFSVRASTSMATGG